MNDSDDFTPDRIPTYEEWCIALNRCEQKLAVSQAEVARLENLLAALAQKTVTEKK